MSIRKANEVCKTNNGTPFDSVFAFPQTPKFRDLLCSPNLLSIFPHHHHNALTSSRPPSQTAPLHTSFFVQSSFHTIRKSRLRQGNSFYASSGAPERNALPPEEACTRYLLAWFVRWRDVPAIVSISHVRREETVSGTSERKKKFLIFFVFLRKKKIHTNLFVFR